jgi:hypothetical protein
MRHSQPALGLATGLLLLACARAAPEPLEAPRPIPGLEQRVASAVNAYRASRGLGRLAWNDAVAEQARRHSRAMAQGRRGFGHQGFEARAAHIAEGLPLRGAAENIYRTTLDRDVAQLALERWIASRVHRRNLEGSFDVAGVGAAHSASGEIFLTQIFVARRSAAAGSGPAAGRAFLHALDGLLGGALRPVVLRLRTVDGDAVLAGLGPALALGRALAAGDQHHGDQESARPASAQARLLPSG